MTDDRPVGFTVMPDLTIEERATLITRTVCGEGGCYCKDLPKKACVWCFALEHLRAVERQATIGVTHAP